MSEGVPTIDLKKQLAIVPGVKKYETQGMDTLLGFFQLPEDKGLAHLKEGYEEDGEKIAVSLKNLVETGGERFTQAQASKIEALANAYLGRDSHIVADLLVALGNSARNNKRAGSIHAEDMHRGFDELEVKVLQSDVAGDTEKEAAVNAYLAAIEAVRPGAGFVKEMKKLASTSRFNKLFGRRTRLQIYAQDFLERIESVKK